MDPKHQGKVNELVEAFAATLKVECEKLYRSGMVDVERFDPDQYPLAKVLLTAAIERQKDAYAPINNPALDRAVKNLVLV